LLSLIISGGIFMQEVTHQQPNQARDYLVRAFNEYEAAKYIGAAPASLRQARCHGDREGQAPTPRHIKIGRSVRYLKEDLDSFLDGLRNQSKAA
jgi:hypothetical protein